MLKSIGGAFKGLIIIFFVILFILISYLAYYVGNRLGIQWGLLTWFLCLIFIIFIFGFISIISNIDTNLQKIVKYGFKISGNNIFLGNKNSPEEAFVDDFKDELVNKKFNQKNTKVCNNCEETFSEKKNKCPKCGSKDFSEL